MNIDLTLDTDTKRMTDIDTMTDAEGLTDIEMITDTEEMINLNKRLKSDVTFVMLWIHVCTWFYRKVQKRKCRKETPGPGRQKSFNDVDDSCNLKELHEQYSEALNC